MKHFPNCELIKVNYEFQKGGNQMLLIRKWIVCYGYRNINKESEMKSPIGAKY
jgi:hypothetical protein